jgi:hypothetical protein
MQVERTGGLVDNTVFQAIDELVRNESSGNRSTVPLSHVLSPEEKERFRSGSPVDKNEVARNVEVRLARPSLRTLAASVHRYHKAFNRLALKTQQDDEIFAQLGEPPWVLVNSALEALGLPYQLDIPNMRTTWHEDGGYLLRDLRTDRPVGGHEFSAGERVLLALCDLLLSDVQTGKKLYMFDDVDGLLHAPALKHFIGFVRDRLIREQGHIAIWATHSPVTVQLAGNADHFYIREPRVSPEPITRPELIDRLSGGELVVLDNTVLVFVEGQDHRFYNTLFRRLEHDQAIRVSRSARFISPTTDPHNRGAGRDAVQRAIEVLTQTGFSRLAAGLVDGDGRTSSLPAGVERLPRYSIENYWLDPLNVHAWLLDHDVRSIPTELTFENVSQGMGSKITSALNRNQLQRIVDHWANEILQRWNAVVNANPLAGTVSTTAREEVSFVGGLSLSYPSFLLQAPGKEIIDNAYHRGVNTNLHRGNLEKHYFVTAAWPVELVALMQRLATAPMT